ncbi:unnamed protein product, partial [Porites evermanni]
GRQALARQGYLTVGFVINTSNQLIEERRKSLTFLNQKVHYIINPGSMMNPRTKKSDLNLSFLDDETANGTIIIGLVLILSFGNAVEGGYCSLQSEELEEGNCRSLVNGTSGPYYAMECH